MTEVDEVLVPGEAEPVNPVEGVDPLEGAALSDGVALSEDGEECVDTAAEGDDLVCVRVQGVQVMINKIGLAGIADGVLESLRVTKGEELMGPEKSSNNGGMVVRLRGGFKKRVRGIVDVKNRLERDANVRRLEYLDIVEGRSRGSRRRNATRSTYRKIRGGGLPRLEEAQDWFV